MLVNNRFFYLGRDLLFFSNVVAEFNVNCFFLADNIFLLFSVFQNSCFIDFLKIPSKLGLGGSRFFFSSLASLRLFFFSRSKLGDFLYGTFIELFLDGLYYRVKYYKSKNYLGFLIGFSHYIIIKVPEFVFVQVHTKRRKFIIFSSNKHQLSVFAVFLASLKFPNVYMGKGIKIANKFYRQKKMLKKR